MADAVSHDQNFKNLIVDYPREALAFFAAAEAPRPEDDVRIVPVRQEQLKERLGDRYRALDAPLLVDWADGRRDAVVFALEEESDWRRFSPHRLARYCLDLAEMFDTDRVVPVAIFLRAATALRHPWSSAPGGATTSSSTTWPASSPRCPPDVGWTATTWWRASTCEHAQPRPRPGRRLRPRGARPADAGDGRRQASEVHGSSSTSTPA